MIRSSKNIAVIVLVACIVGCGQGDPVPSPDEAAPESLDEQALDTVVDVHTIRGEVTRMPDAEGARRLYIRHEAVPGYRDVDGEVVGMKSMVMPFMLSDSVSTEGIDVGTKIEFDWEITSEAPAGSVIRLVTLAPETELAIERADSD